MRGACSLGQVGEGLALRRTARYARFVAPPQPRQAQFSVFGKQLPQGGFPKTRFALNFGATSPGFVPSNRKVSRTRDPGPPLQLTRSSGVCGSASW